jgi:protein TonB
LEGFLNYIGKNIKYPEEARKQGIEGKVFVRFVITKNGSISQVEVIKGMGYGLDEEAARVVSAYQKKWKPGINKGEKVNTEMVLPINYAL